MELAQAIEIEQVYIHDSIRNWNEIYGEEIIKVSRKRLNAFQVIESITLARILYMFAV